jgi:hypothetical protein
MLTDNSDDSEAHAAAIKLEPTWSGDGRLLFSNHGSLSPNTMATVNGRPLNVDVTMEAEAVPETLQRLISKTMHQQWPEDTFENSFPDLADMTKVFMAKYRRSIDADADKMDVFGVKLSISILKTIGILILAGCQLYLWLHTEELRRLIPTLVPGTWIVGWIGLYPTKAARAFIAFSTFILPFFAVAAVVLTGWPDNTPPIRLVEGAFGGCSLILSGLMGSSLMRLWASVDNLSVDAFPARLLQVDIEIQRQFC